MNITFLMRSCLGDDWITAGLTPKFAFLLLLLLCAVDAGRVWGLDGRRRKSPRGKSA